MISSDGNLKVAERSVAWLDPQTVYQFGGFRLDPGRRLLTRDDLPVTLSSRGFDILQLLIEHRDRIVTREEILRHVWPGVTVETANIGVQMSALRRALGEPSDAPTLIGTVPGRGFRFIGALETPDAPPEALEISGPDAPPVRPEIAIAAPAIAVAPRWAPPRTPVAAAALAVLAFGGAYLLLGPGLSWRRAAPRLSIVVLPFRNLSEDRGQDYLAEAVSDDLTTDLAHIPGSVVIARETADTFKGHAVAVQRIGRALRVRYVLEGSLRPDGDILRINAQLIDAATDAHLWAERFEVPRGGLADAQSAIVQRIAAALDVTLVAIEDRRSRRDRPDNPDALDLYYRGRALLDQRDDMAGMTETQHLFERAIAAQPDFVDALNDLGWLLLNKSNEVAGADARADEAEAAHVIANALRIAPRRPRVLASQGMLQTLVGDCRAAIATYQTALDIDPNEMRAHAGLATCAWRLGDVPTALQQVNEALRLDPLGASAKWRYQLLGMMQFFLGRCSEAIQSSELAITGEPDPQPGSDELGRMEWSRLFLIASREKAGQHEPAARAWLAYARLWQHRSIWRMLTYFTAAQARLPGMTTLHDALRAAGMPEFADPREDDHVPQSTSPHGGGDFDATPRDIPGGRVVDATEVASMLRAPGKPILVDVGPAVASIPGSIRARALDGTWAGSVAKLADQARRDPAMAGHIFVVFGAGTFGWDGYDASLTLLRGGLTHVVWFRGGEEAWAAAGMAAEDRREP